MKRTHCTFVKTVATLTLLNTFACHTTVVQAQNFPPVVRRTPYVVQDLGVVSSTYGMPLGCINGSGLFYGTRRDAGTNLNNRAFWGTSTQRGDLFYRVGTNSWSNGTNNSLEVAGCREGRAVIWDIDWLSAQFLPDNNDPLAPFVGMPTSEAFGINAGRQVVGYAATHYAERVWTKATLWLTDTRPNNNTVTRIDLGDGVARAINTQGKIAGTHTSPFGINPRACFWNNNATHTRTDLFNTTSASNDINVSGLVVGSVLTNPTTSRGFAFNSTTGATTILTPISNILNPLLYANCTTLALNDAGVAVGQSWNVSTSTSRASIWFGGAFGATARDLNSGVPVGTPVLTSAVDINNAGQILCEGFVNGTRHAFLLSPTGAPFLWL